MRQFRLLFFLEAKRCRRKKTWIVPMILVLILGISTFSYFSAARNSTNIEQNSNEFNSLEFNSPEYDSTEFNSTEFNSPEFNLGSVSSDCYITLGIVNRDSSEYAALLMNYFGNNELFTKYVEIIEDEELPLKQRMEDGRLDCLLVIPEDFAEKMITLENIPVSVTVSTENRIKALLLSTVLAAYERYITSVEVNCAALYDRMKAEGYSYEARNRTNVDISLDLIFTALGKDAFFERRQMEREKNTPLTAQYSYAFYYLIFLFLCFPVGLKLQELMESGVFLRLRAIGVSTAGMFFSKVLPYLVFAAAAAVFPVLLRTKGIGGDIEMAAAGQMWLTSFCLFVPMVFLLALFGVLTGKKQTYLLICSLLWIGLALAGGSIIPPLYLPEQFLAVTRFLPNYVFLSVPAGELGADVLPVAGICAGAAAAVSVSFSVCYMSCGKRK